LTTLLLALAIVGAKAPEPLGPRLAGAFIQFGDTNKNYLWTPEQWNQELDAMRKAGLNLVIIQWVEVRGDRGPRASRVYAPVAAGAPDPLGAILKYADDMHQRGVNPMTAFVGLRVDGRLEQSAFLNRPDLLEKELAEELDLTSKLAQRLTQAYDLKHRASFGGWYLPVEVTNYKVTVNDPLRTWPRQLNKLTRNLVAACRGQVDRPVAVSPFINSRLTNGEIPVFQGGKIVNGSLPHWLVGPVDMRKNYTEYLKGGRLLVSDLFSPKKDLTPIILTPIIPLVAIARGFNQPRRRPRCVRPRKPRPLPPGRRTSRRGSHRPRRSTAPGQSNGSDPSRREMTAGRPAWRW